MNTVVDRLVEGGVPGVCVERQIDVDGVRPLKRERKAGLGKSEVCCWTKVSHHVGWRQEWHRAKNLYSEGQGGQGEEVAGNGSRRCGLTG